MKLGWMILGGLIIIAIFIFFPGLFQSLVSFVQKIFDMILSAFQSTHNTNLTGH
jgi:hypothetical protein